MKNYKEKIKLLQRARKEKWAIGQFNVSNLETMKGIFGAAQKLKSPVIIGTSERESDFLGLMQAVFLTRAFEEETGVPAILNLDHATNLDYIKKAIEAGYDAVHFDGSKMDFKENIETAKRLVEFGCKKEVLVEGEFDPMQGSSKILERAPDITKENLTDPVKAEKFLKETKVDSLAISVGTFHGVDSSEKDSPIDIERLLEIQKKIGDKAFLVLHGGSGVEKKDIKDAINSGIVKININTDIRIAFTRALRESLKNNPKENTPYKYMPLAIAAVEKTIEEKIQLFGSANKF